MNKVTLVGDTHGKLMGASFFPDGAIQVGDFNLGGYDQWVPSKEHPGRRLAFIDGNHDHFPSLDVQGDRPQLIQPGLFYLPRAWVCGRVMFIGGAESIDHRTRHFGWDIFPEESITQRDFQKALAHQGPIEVVISHTCPDFVVDRMLRGGSNYDTSSEKALEAIWEKFRPGLWVFGHFHMCFDRTIRDTRFVCLHIQEQREFSLPLENWPGVLSDEREEPEDAG